jgi:hypothetical protein
MMKTSETPNAEIGSMVPSSGYNSSTADRTVWTVTPASMPAFLGLLAAGLPFLYAQWSPALGFFPPTRSRTPCPTLTRPAQSTQALGWVDACLGLRYTSNAATTATPAAAAAAAAACTLLLLPLLLLLLLLHLMSLLLLLRALCAGTQS